MSDNYNLRHWATLGKTDPKHTKPFTRAGGFKGTATKPIWIEYRLTEHFGPCGIGWGCDEPQFTLVPAGEEILVFCTLRCWYAEDDKQASLYGVGGDKVLAKRREGPPVADDEAYKKAFTDALGNAFKHVGSNADVHMGLFEDSKYLAQVKQEFAQEAATLARQDTAQPAQTPFDDPAPAQRAPPAVAPDRAKAVESAREAKDRIKAAIENARTPKLIEEIISINSDDLAFIKEIHAPAYEKLMVLANARRVDLMASA